MAGYFELVEAPDGGYRLRMLDGAGNLMAVTVTFPTRRAAVAGVAQVREIAGTGLVRDRSTDRQYAAAARLSSAGRRTGGVAAGGASRAGGSPAAGKRARAHR
jgi:uncharacterized protein YegP (UPF0339 family)